MRLAVFSLMPKGFWTTRRVNFTLRFNCSNTQPRRSGEESLVGPSGAFARPAGGFSLLILIVRMTGRNNANRPALFQQSITQRSDP
jgi:hypothetical protein